MGEIFLGFVHFIKNGIQDPASIFLMVIMYCMIFLIVSSFYVRICSLFTTDEEEYDEEVTDIQKKFGRLFIIYEEDAEYDYEDEIGDEDQNKHGNFDEEDFLAEDESIMNEVACEEEVLKKHNSLRSISTDYTEDHASDSEDSIDRQSEEFKEFIQTNC